ncbi:hypothetical protein N7451_012437 [Penicillium sp. IBT 35674x]|nr:hypothetical protein N7451_012437 [Penicillium sp. IBT 35674x]
MVAVNDSIQELQLKTDSTTIQVPCLGHIIQLSPIDLLGRIKAPPKNDTVEPVWSDDRVRLLRACQQKHEIADTLNKVRGLAVYINGSPQRKEAFLNLQPNGQKLVLIQDVRTRWNSTFLMLRQAKRLHITLDEYCSHHDQPHFALSAEGWRQIDYVLCILQPFFAFTILICQTKHLSIHHVFNIYNRLFDHPERSMRKLRRSKVSWKQLMLSSLEAAKDKLSEYYGMTDDVEGDLYAIGTILNPSNKMEFFSTSDWPPDNTGKDYEREYRESLQTLFKRYSLRVPSNMTQSDRVSSEQEIAATSEELDIETHCSEAISDTEEDAELHLTTPTAPPLSEVAAGKRPAITFNDDEDSNADGFADPEENSASPLPDTQLLFNSLSLKNPVF